VGGREGGKENADRAYLDFQVSIAVDNESVTSSDG